MARDVEPGEIASPSRPGRFPDPIPSIIPFCSLTIFAGAPAVGKTTMLLDWIRRWWDGRTICHHETNPPTMIYYVGADRGQRPEDFQERVGVGPEKCQFYSIVSAASKLNVEDFANPAHGRALLQHVMAELNPQPGAHVIIDPLSPLFITGNPNSSRDVAASLIRLSRLMEDRQINITRVAHFAKQKADKSDRYRRPQDRVSGSYAFSGYSDTQIYLCEPEPPVKHYTLGWNPRKRAPEDFAFQRDDAGWFVPITRAEDIGALDETSRAFAVMRLLPDDGYTYSQWQAIVMHQFGISEATFERDLSLLRQHGLVVRWATTRRWYQKTQPKPVG